MRATLSVSALRRVLAIAAAVWCIVDAPDAYAADVARKTDSLTFKVIVAYLILAFVCWGVFWVVSGGWRHGDD